MRLIAVTKTHGPDAVEAAYEEGIRDVGENKVQEALDKMALTAGLPLAWHLIGHLQSNKAKKAATAFAWIHSIDSLDLLKKVDAAAADAGTRPHVLVQVGLAHEATKSGADVTDVPAIIDAALAGRAVQLAGLMLVPPIVDDPNDARPWFRELRGLRDRWVADGVPADRLRELSMGMSHDFEVAIEEGATMVRIGSAVFGRRDYTA